MSYEQCLRQVLSLKSLWSNIDKIRILSYCWVIQITLKDGPKNEFYCVGKSITVSLCKTYYILSIENVNHRFLFSQLAPNFILK
jgi:hypothetical protein